MKKRIDSIGGLRVTTDNVPVATLKRYAEKGRPPEMLAIPSAAEMVLQLREQKRRCTLPELYRLAAETLAQVCETERANVSSRLRAEIAEAEKFEVGRWPAGNRGLAILALETVANAISCWSLQIAGRPLKEHAGVVYCPPNGPGSRLDVWMPGGKREMCSPDTLGIILDEGTIIDVPSWFLDTWDIPLPLDFASVRGCAPAASKALREYLWMMIGWNRKHHPWGEPIGGEPISGPLKWYDDEERRTDEEKEKTNTRGKMVEAMHKNACGEISKRIEFLPLERLPFQIHTRW